MSYAALVRSVRFLMLCRGVNVPRYCGYKRRSLSSPMERFSDEVELDETLDEGADVFPVSPSKKALGEAVIVLKHVHKGAFTSSAPPEPTALPPPRKDREQRIVISTVMVSHGRAEYALQGRDDRVVALEDIHVCHGSEFYPIRRSGAKFKYQF